MATYYWVPGGNGNWSSSSNWASSSGGSSGAGVPGSSDDVVFDANSGSGPSTVNTSTSVLSVNATGAAYGFVIDLGTNTLTIKGTGNALIVSNAAFKGSVGSMVLFDYSGSSAMTVDTGTYADNVVCRFSAGTYALSLAGRSYDLDFWVSGTGTYAGSVTFLNTVAVYHGCYLSSGTAIASSSGLQIAYGQTVYIRTNGVFVDTEVQVLGTLVLQDALSCYFLYVLSYGSVSDSGYNVTASRYAAMNGRITFGAGRPTWASELFSVASTTTFTGQGTATISVTDGGIFNLSSASVRARIPATISAVKDMIINGTSGATVAFLKLTSAYTSTSSIRISVPATFVEIVLNGSAPSNYITLDGKGKTLTKVDPWYVGANSSDGGGNTGISFVSGEGMDYLYVANVVGAYNYGPHFMAFM